ncbi:MAG TPA: hypothetical protein VIH25_03405 [Steroidobacteraceae bacterium]
MTTRRDVLAAGLAAGILPHGLPASAVPRANGAILRPYRIVVDSRFSASAPLARAANRKGLAVSTITGDVTKLWYDDLYHRWRRGAAPIAGLTDPTALFCLEQIAWDVGMRVLLRIEHARVSGSLIEHRVTAPAGLLSHARALGQTSAPWSSDAARLVLEFPARTVRGDQASLTVESRFADSSDPAFLVSWVIGTRV